jgi:rubrerythrin
VEQVQAGEASEATDYVHFFFTTGEAAKGEFHCSECGYGVTVHSKLPACPMCASTEWEQTAWSPMTRAFSAL